MKMNKNLLEQLKSFSLDKDEKKQVKSEIIQHMEDNPVRIDDESRHILQKQSGLIGLFNSFLTKKAMTGSIVAAVMVLFGGGTSFAAEGSLPGDTLYPIKTSVNEEVVSMVKVSNKSQAKWDIRRSERRLEEIEKLAAKGEISQEAKTEAKTRLESHIEDVKKNIEEMEKEGDSESSFEIASGLETSLKAHQRVLEKIQAKSEQENEVEAETETSTESSEETNTEETSTNKGKAVLQNSNGRGIGDIISSLRAESKSAAEIKAKIQEKIENRSKGKNKKQEKEQEDNGEEKDSDREEEQNEEESSTTSKKEAPQVRAAAEGKMKAAANKIDVTERFIAKKESRLSSSTKAEASSELKAAENIFAEGKAELDSENYGKAFIKFQEAHEKAQSAKIVVTASMNAGIEVGDVMEADMQVETESETEPEDEREKNKEESEDNQGKNERKEERGDNKEKAQKNNPNRPVSSQDDKKEDNGGSEIEAEDTEIDVELEGEAEQGSRGIEINSNANVKAKNKVKANVRR